MSPEVIGIIGIVFLLVLMFCNIKLGVCFIIVGFLGYALIFVDKALLMVGLEPFAQMNYTFTSKLLFLLMGQYGCFRHTRHALAVRNGSAISGSSSISARLVEFLPPLWTSLAGAAMGMWLIQR